MRDQRGFTLLEAVISLLIGSLILLALSSLYIATTSALAVSTSQATLQRQGQEAMEEIARQMRRADNIAAGSATCPPAGSAGPSLWVRVPTTLANNGEYCYYAGTAGNGAPAGVLCERFTPTGGAAGGCRNLLGGGGAGAGGGAALGLVRQAQPAGITLVVQTAPVDARCPFAAGTVPAAGQFCFALTPAPALGGTFANVAFAITDGLGSMTFGVTLTRRN